MKPPWLIISVETGAVWVIRKPPAVPHRTVRDRTKQQPTTTTHKVNIRVQFESPGIAAGLTGVAASCDTPVRRAVSSPGMAVGLMGVAASCDTSVRRAVSSPGMAAGLTGVATSCDASVRRAVSSPGMAAGLTGVAASCDTPVRRAVSPWAPPVCPSWLSWLTQRHLCLSGRITCSGREEEAAHKETPQRLHALHERNASQSRGRVHVEGERRH